MLFYYSTTTGETFYFSVWVNVVKEKIHITEIEEDDLWHLVKDGNLELTEISPTDFRYPLPGNISGNVKAFII